MKTQRIIRVDFHLPIEDANFRLTELRDTIQQELYDNAGLSGNFQIIGRLDLTDAEAAETLEANVAPYIPDNAARIIEQEAKARFSMKGEGGRVRILDKNGECVFNMPYGTDDEARGAGVTLMALNDSPEGFDPASYAFTVSATEDPDLACIPARITGVSPDGELLLLFIEGSGLAVAPTALKRL